VDRRRIQPKAAVERETVSLGLPPSSSEWYAQFLGGSADRTHVITQAIEIPFGRTRTSRRR
jgi:hypothetical protein